MGFGGRGKRPLGKRHADVGVVWKPWGFDGGDGKGCVNTPPSICDCVRGCCSVTFAVEKLSLLLTAFSSGDPYLDDPPQGLQGRPYVGCREP